MIPYRYPHSYPYPTHFKLSLDSFSNNGYLILMSLATTAQNSETHSSSQSFQQTPHNLEVEAALLGVLLRNNKYYDKIVEITLQEHFYHLGHQRIFTLIVSLLEQGKVANEDTLAHHASQDDILVTLGGNDYLKTLANNVLSMISIHEYAKLLRELFIKRQLIEISETCIVDVVHNTQSDAAGQIETIEQKLFMLAETDQSEHKIQPLKHSVTDAIDMIAQAVRNEGQLTGISSGFSDIDKLLGGFHKSDLIILAGRPSMGKTALALNMAYNAACLFKEIKDENGKITQQIGGKVAVFSLEMSSIQLASRLLSAATKIPGDSLRRGNLNQKQYSTVARAATTMDSIPLFIDDTPALSVSAIRQRARRLKRTQGLDLIVIDYLQLLQAPPGNRSDNRVQEISIITRTLKAIAKELNIPVLVLSQLSRAVESRDPPIPHLADLRDSGAIEQDADVVMFLYRAEYYLGRKHPERRENESDDKFALRQQNHQQHLEETRNIAQLFISKQRHGPIGTTDLFFNADATLFADLASGKHSP